MNKVKSEKPNSHEFLNAHILILEDSFLRKEVIDLIMNQHLNSSEAFAQVMDKYIAMIRESNNQYLQDRYLDFLDIKARVLQNINRTCISLTNLDECILLVDELFPSLLINISKNVKGIIAKRGGFTSHSAILCRAMGIPFVLVDIPDDFTGNILIDKNVVYLNPTQDIVDCYLEEENEEITKNLGDIKVYANIINNNDIDNIGDEFSGVGLYRTEFILANPEYAFDYQKQAQIYKEALIKMNGRSITFRTFDLGGDKQVDYLPPMQKGIINYYYYPKLFENQVKALLVAANEYPKQVKVMFPMIESYIQYEELKKYVLDMAKSLGVDVPRIGMMLETQSALINLKDFKDVDFISVGTNDLTSELFNVSRDEFILFDDLYDNLIDILTNVIKFADENKIELSVCGELISKVEFARKVIACGLKNVSISSYFINNIYKAVNQGE